MPNDALSSSLAGSLYADVKHWMVNVVGRARRRRQRAQARRFDNLVDYVAAAQTGELRDGQEVVVRCRPAPYAKFKRHHFLSVTIGPRSDMRRGPSIVAANWPVAAMAQLTTHLAPVGLFPALPGRVRQAVLYPADTPVCGVVSLMPFFGNDPPTVPAIVSDQFEPNLGHVMDLRGHIRFMDAASLVAAGFVLEEHEALRQQGRLWFFDATDETAEADKIDTNVGELWGALYVEGHAHVEGGSLPRGPVFESVSDAMAVHGLEPFTSENQAGHREITIYAKGVRAHFDGRLPVYSLHMDVELLNEFAGVRTIFDYLTSAIHEGFDEAARQGGAAYLNPRDVDFTYSDSTSAYTVLRSMAAEDIADPVAVAIRDWHRQRGRARESS